MEFDLPYLTQSLGGLCGVPVRIYSKGQKTFFYSQLSFPKDPITLYETEILQLHEKIGYYTTKDFYFFGYLRYQDEQIVIGPFRPIQPTQTMVLDYGIKMGIKGEDLESFLNAMKNIVAIPLESVMKSLSMIYYVLYKEKISLEKLVLHKVTDEIPFQTEDSKDKRKENTIMYEHNTYQIENDICRLIEHGDVDKLISLIQNIPAVRVGSLSDDYLRQLKNTFIVTATLFSRAAIRGHLEVHEAMGLSDVYIQKVERLTNEKDISMLQAEMLLDFAKKVQRVKGISDASPLVISLNQYIYSHISMTIKIPDICQSLYVSKSYLFEKIKKETGKTVGEYIMDMKIEEAKRYLRYTDKSYSTISYYLGFSTQSHFNRVFKEKTTFTPKEYRLKHKKG